MISWITIESEGGLRIIRNPEELKKICKVVEMAKNILGDNSLDWSWGLGDDQTKSVLENDANVSKTGNILARWRQNLPVNSLGFFKILSSCP
jgi:hypothetical protein